MKKLEKKSKLSLLYIEDEPFIRKNAVEFLSDKFSKIFEASNGKEGLILYKDKKPDIIITDISMPLMGGLEFCRLLRKSDHQTPIIITTAYADKAYLLEAIELNLVKYLIKPIDEQSLIEALNICFLKLQDSTSNVIWLSDNHCYDIFNKTLLQKNEIIKLTKTESILLNILAKNINKVVSYEEIENLFLHTQDKFLTNNALKALIKNLRIKIDKNAIKNYSKIGYKLHVQDR